MPFEHSPGNDKDTARLGRLERFARALIVRPIGVLSRVLGAPSRETAMSPEAEVAAFDKLRTDTHARMRLEYAERMATNPTPTPQERALGMYVENLEPQVRGAVFSMREKGYPTRASGFFHGVTSWRIIGIEGEDVPVGTYAPTYDPVNKRAQTMSFSQGLELDQPTIDGLAEVGAEVVRHPSDGLIHSIGFVPDAPDLDAITAQWNAVASVLPDTGAPVPPAETFRPGFADWGATAP